jgi:D-serine deaminase-like pyridoxal phosphate-dependent protein
VRALALSAEYGTILLEQPAECPRVGDRLELEVGYHDQAVHLHEVIVGVRNGIIEAVWPVAARGRLQ